MTEKELITLLRLCDLYKNDYLVKEAQKWKAVSINMWIKISNKAIERRIQKNNEDKIRKYKNLCKRSNKKQYLIAYK